MRVVPIVLLALVALNCRDIQPVAGSFSIQGYQINGTISTPNGVPIDSVSVILYYYYVLSYAPPLDTQRVVITDSAQFVDITVYSIHSTPVQHLFAGIQPPGVVSRAQWDGLDSTGKAVPSGKYFIQYKVGSTVEKRSPVLIDGHTTTMTDLSGTFTITNDHFPVGDFFDIYSSDGTYDKTIQIAPEVDLEFLKVGVDRVYTIQLTKDQITTQFFTIQ